VGETYDYFWDKLKRLKATGAIQYEKKGKGEKSAGLRFTEKRKQISIVYWVGAKWKEETVT